MSDSPAKPLSRQRAMTCLLINQFATPGLGSLMGRRKIAGAGQLLLSVAGFTMVVVWFFQVMIFFYGLMFDTHSDPKIRYGLLKLGSALFGVAWLWAWFTSISLVREVRRNAVAELQRPLT